MENVISAEMSRGQLTFGCLGWLDFFEIVEQTYGTGVKVAFVVVP